MCGVVGVVHSKGHFRGSKGSPNASQSLKGLEISNTAAHESFLALTTLQHRGQDAAGILTFDSEGFHSVKNIGLVESVFSRESFSELTGSVAIAHARYSTIGRGDLRDVQPFVLSYPFGIGIVHNGNLINTKELSHELKTKSRRQLLTSSDTELILNIFAENLPANEDLNFEKICKAVEVIHSRAVGSYSIVSLIADFGVVAFRDPNGIRPLVWGKRKESDGSYSYMVASESGALSFLGYAEIQDVKPGEVICITPEGDVFQKVLSKSQSTPCMFEWVYFASPESTLSEAAVYAARINLGKELAKTIEPQIKSGKIKPDLIVPVPETSRIAAISLSEELKIPYREVLIKNRYIKRTFILDSNEKRQRAVNLKLLPVRSEIEGKNILLVDDSIVRGTTSKRLVELVKNAGAKEVYFVSTCPPITHPCYYGIDFPDAEELIAFNKTNEEIKNHLGADAVIYQTEAGLTGAIQEAAGKKINLCAACLSGKYPTDTTSARNLAKTRVTDRMNTKPSAG